MAPSLDDKHTYFLLNGKTYGFLQGTQGPPGQPIIVGKAHATPNYDQSFRIAIVKHTPRIVTLQTATGPAMLRLNNPADGADVQLGVTSGPAPTNMQWRVIDDGKGTHENYVRFQNVATGTFLSLSKTGNRVIGTKGNTDAGQRWHWAEVPDSLKPLQRLKLKEKDEKKLKDDDKREREKREREKREKEKRERERKEREKRKREKEREERERVGWNMPMAVSTIQLPAPTTTAYPHAAAGNGCYQPCYNPCQRRC